MTVSPATLASPRTLAWALSALWVLLAPVMAFAITDAADGRSTHASLAASILWWLAVGAMVIAVVVPSALTLTVVRMLAPASAPAATLTLLLGARAVLGAPALALALLVTIVGFAGEIGEVFVQGSAYGHEKRYPLKVPAGFVLPMVSAWVVWCATLISAVLLFGGHHWIAGAICGAAAIGLTVLLLGRFHRFSMRWLVLVPAGVVIHDPVVLGETLMVPKPNVRLVRLAPADTEAADLTGPAAGHAIEITVGEMVLTVLAGTSKEPKGKALHVQSFLIAPTRPGRALNAMAAANLPTG